MATPRPVNLRLQKTSRVLEVEFDTGETFRLPCELLRVWSPSAEVMGHGPDQRVLQLGKEMVNIAGIDPVGNYAVLLRFDDGHDTGIFSWQTLYDLGKNQDTYWQRYVTELAAAGHARAPVPGDAS